jgi:DNA polymerase family B, exonuclease domain
MTRATTTPAVAPRPSVVAIPPPSRRYGLDIETDTTLDGLDATRAAILAVAVSTVDGDEVLMGDERDVLRRLDELLASLAPGLLVTWNGTFFDLPFIAERAALLGLDLGLRLGGERCVEWPPERRPGPYRCNWWQHRHLDGYRLYRDDLGRAFGLSCGLKPLSRLVGLVPVEVDRTAMHLLSDQQMREYVASDARLARQLVDRRMPLAFASADRPVDDPDGLDPDAGGPRPGPDTTWCTAAGATLARS